MDNSKPIQWLLVMAGCIGMFAATSTGSTRAPFLNDIAAEFSVSFPAVSNLFGLTATVWGLSSYVTGAVSDRFGRRVFLIGAPFLLALTMVCAAMAPSYWMLVVIVALAAVCCGAFTAAAMAEISLQTANSHQGRALGLVMAGQSLTLLIGIPIAAWLGASIGWRGAHAVLSLLALFATGFMVFALYRLKQGPGLVKQTHDSNRTIRDVLTGPITRLCLAMIAERLCFGLAAFYYASFLRTVYDLPINAVALPLALFAVGNIVGTMIGGPIADRFPYRRVSVAVSLFFAGLVALPWFSWQTSVNVTVFLGALFAFLNALARPSLVAALADVPANDRSIIMGLNSSIASVGWLCAALVGGWLYTSIGFVSFGPVMLSMCLIAGLIIVPDSRIRTGRA